MEPLWSPVGATRGNRWQIAKARNRGSKPRTVAVGCDRLREEAHGKEGVSGSSPEEGSPKEPQIGAFCLARTCTISSVQCVWSPLWSLQVQSARSKASEMDAFAGRLSRSVSLNRIFEHGLRFEPSHEHAGLQLVDIASYVTRRPILEPDNPRHPPRPGQKQPGSRLVSTGGGGKLVWASVRE
jgi:hypothetical protein